MNITGAVLVGLLYLVPGILFVAGLSRLYTSRSPSLFDGQISLGIVVSVVAAIFLHAACIALGHLIAPRLGWPVPNAADGIFLLLGDSRTPAFQATVLRVTPNWPYVSAYFIGASIISFVLGKCANRIVKPNRRADWYELLRTEADLIWLTAHIDVGGEAFLYAGMVKEFKVSGDGELQRVVLLGAVRRPLKRPTKEEIDEQRETYNEKGWIEIPGEYVVLQMDSARTVNIDYWYLTGEEDGDASDSDDAERAEGAGQPMADADQSDRSPGPSSVPS